MSPNIDTRRPKNSNCCKITPIKSLLRPWVGVAEYCPIFYLHQISVHVAWLGTHPSALRCVIVLSVLWMESWAPPGRGNGGTLLDFDINFSHIITVAPTVEIQMHYWKTGLNLPAPLDIQ